MEAYGRLQDNLFLWSNKGQNDFDRILEAFRFWAVVEGVQHFVLDNVTCLVSHLELTQQNVEINRIARDLAGFADELGVMVDVYSHLNPPGGNKSHENGAEVRENQFTGSRALQRWSHFMLGFERNKQADGDEKHLSRIRLLKNRPYGLTGIIHTKYDPDTGCLEETDEHEIPITTDDEPFV
jgi:twinkle protein